MTGALSRTLLAELIRELDLGEGVGREGRNWLGRGREGELKREGSWEMEGKGT